MSPKGHLLLLATLAVLAGIGIIIAIFITLTPRHISYSVCTKRRFVPSIGRYAPGICTVRKAHPFEATLSEAMVDLNLDFGVDSDYRHALFDSLEEYDVEPRDIPVKEAIQVSDTQVTGNREYILFAADDSERTLAFVDPEADDAEDVTTVDITASNENLRIRQTGILVFMEMEAQEPSEGCKAEAAPEGVVGYILNNVWMKARADTLIHLVVPGRLAPGSLLVIRDLDENGESFYV